MSVFALSIMDRASTVVNAIVDLQDVLDWIEKRVDDGDGVPSLHEVADVIDDQQPDDLEFRMVRTDQGGVALALAAESFTETDAFDGMPVLASSLDRQGVRA